MADRRRGAVAGFRKRIGDELIGVPAAFDQDDPAGGRAAPPCGALERAVHGQRMGLGVKREPAQKQHGHVLGSETEGGARAAPLVGRKREFPALDAERDHGHLGRRDLGRAQVFPKVFDLRAQDRQHDVAQGGRGADQRVPGLQRRGRQGRDRVHGHRRGNRVGHPAQAPSARVDRVPLPRRFGERGAGIEQAPRLGETGDRFRPQGPHARARGNGVQVFFERLARGLVGDVDPAVAGCRIAQVRLEETVPRHVATHQLGPFGVVGVVGEKKRGVAHECRRDPRAGI